MGNITIERWNKGQRKKYCIRGHDREIFGRYGKNGSCKQCTKERSNTDEYREKERIRSREIWKTESGRNRRIESQWKMQGIKNESGEFFKTSDYDRVYQIQQGCCAGCKIHKTELSKNFHVDHDHNTGIFRWLLCGMCNHLLGNARDNPVTLRNLANLLEVRYGIK